MRNAPPFFLHITVTVRLFFFPLLLFSRRGTRMTEEKTTRELVYETNRDVKWICRMLQRMEAQDEEFEARIRALEGWRAEKVGEERRVSTIGAGAGGVVGGVVAVIVKVLGGG
ncbi:hypothetical protein MchiMG62_19830 [Methanoculleus chikugoensis]|uniref:Uncharacterized protein n=2 Tax=Methanoculleus chikugoensis TaxID=118126 RepID=A0ABN5XJ78_9EURY|nr:hypothetical protein MchiMG62_19830 [Methanoculleus chikugoensis]